MVQCADTNLTGSFSNRRNDGANMLNFYIVTGFFENIHNICEGLADMNFCMNGVFADNGSIFLFDNKSKILIAQFFFGTTHGLFDPVHYFFSSRCLAFVLRDQCPYLEQVHVIGRL